MPNTSDCQQELHESVKSAFRIPAVTNLDERTVATGKV